MVFPDVGLCYSYIFMSKLFIVGIGGFVGSALRCLVSDFFGRLFENSWFPCGTLAVNAIGCLLIGFLSGIAEARQAFTPEIRLLLFVGFLGGFTTFSTFGYELFSAVRDGQITGAFMNFALHMILAFSGILSGLLLARAL